MGTTMTRTDLDTSRDLVVLRPADIEDLPWQEVAHQPGVRVKELSRAHGFVHAFIVVAPGAHTLGDPHPTAAHHIWVLSGHAAVAGHQVSEGSYVYVPPGVAHPIVGLGPEGCALLQAHRVTRTAGAPASGAVTG
jgi:mannose-6-phosphate isomerase-like protein (cupin superfamily)